MAFGNATKGYVKSHSGGGGGGGTSNYNDLSNKPQINGVELTGNKTSEDLHITASIGLTECESDYDTTNRRFYVPKTAKLITFVGVNNLSNDNYRTPFVLTIEEIKTALTNNYNFSFPVYNNVLGDVTVSENANNYILTYNYADYEFRMRDVFYI